MSTDYRPQDVTPEDHEILTNLGTNRWQDRADQCRDSAIMSRIAFNRKNSGARTIHEARYDANVLAYAEHFL